MEKFLWAAIAFFILASISLSLSNVWERRATAISWPFDPTLCSDGHRVWAARADKNCYAADAPMGEP